jgi:hypothetical protein
MTCVQGAAGHIQQGLTCQRMQSALVGPHIPHPFIGTRASPLQPPSKSPATATTAPCPPPSICTHRSANCSATAPPVRGAFSPRAHKQAMARLLHPTHAPALGAWMLFGDLPIMLPSSRGWYARRYGDQKQPCWMEASTPGSSACALCPALHMQQPPRTAGWR